jgi:hypothetical protein
MPIFAPTESAGPPRGTLAERVPGRGDGNANRERQTNAGLDVTFRTQAALLTFWE